MPFEAGVVLFFYKKSTTILTEEKNKNMWTIFQKNKSLTIGIGMSLFLVSY